MRRTIPTFRNLSFTGRVLYGLGFAALSLLVMLTLVIGSLVTTLAAGVLLLCFMFSAPFVIGGRWRAPRPQPTRRPVVRRRRS